MTAKRVEKSGCSNLGIYAISVSVKTIADLVALLRSSLLDFTGANEHFAGHSLDSLHGML